MNESIGKILSSFGIKTKPKENITQSRLERYRNIPLHAIFLYTSEDSIVSDYLIDNWGALDTLSGEYCDIHQTIDQFDSKEDAYDFVDNLQVIQDSEERIIEKLPGIFFWNMEADSKFISFEGISSKEELTKLIRQLFSKIRSVPSIKTVKRFRTSKSKTASKRNKVFKFKWWMFAISSGVSAMILYKILESNPYWIDEAAVGVVITITVLLLDPVRRFYKAFWSSITLLGTLTLIPAFNLRSHIDTSSLEGIESELFEIVVQDHHWSLYLVLGLMAITSLILDHFERKNKS